MEDKKFNVKKTLLNLVYDLLDNGKRDSKIKECPRFPDCKPLKNYLARTSQISITELYIIKDFVCMGGYYPVCELNKEEDK